jgi:hypothetical protein
MKILVNQEGVNSLFLPNATQDDVGAYSCVARNKLGEASFTVTLKVAGMLLRDILIILNEIYAEFDCV